MELAGKEQQPSMSSNNGDEILTKLRTFAIRSYEHRARLDKDTATSIGNRRSCAVASSELREHDTERTSSSCHTRMSG